MLAASVRWVALLTATVMLPACAMLPLRSDAPRFDLTRVLADVGMPSLWTLERARQVLENVAQARRLHMHDLLLERQACDRGFLVSACLERVADRERRLDERLDALEVAANQRLRDLNARARSEREALQIRENDANASVRRAQEERNRERFDRREQEARSAQSEREAQAPLLQQREQEFQERQRERERALESRQRTSEQAPRR